MRATERVSDKNFNKLEKQAIIKNPSEKNHHKSKMQLTDRMSHDLLGGGIT